MIRSLYTASTGMNAQDTNVSVIANNLANVNTIGFKRSRPEFQDLLYQNLRLVGTLSPNGSTSTNWGSTWFRNKDSGNPKSIFTRRFFSNSESS